MAAYTISAFCNDVVEVPGIRERLFFMVDTSGKEIAFAESKLRTLMLGDVIESINVKLASDENDERLIYTRMPMPEKFSRNYVVSRELKMLSKLKLLGYTVDVFPVDSGEIVYLYQLNDDATLLIPRGIKKVGMLNWYARTVMHSVRGTLTVVGGEDVEDAGCMFSDMVIQKIELKDFNPKNLTDVRLMCKGSAIGSIDFTQVDMSHIELAYNMFEYATIKQLNISNINFNKVKDYDDILFSADLWDLTIANSKQLDNLIEKTDVSNLHIHNMKFTN